MGSTIIQGLIFHGLGVALDIATNPPRKYESSKELTSALAANKALDAEIKAISQKMQNVTLDNLSLQEMVDGKRVKQSYDRYFDLYALTDHSKGVVFPEAQDALSNLLKKYPKLFTEKPKDILKAFEGKKLSPNEQFILTKLPVLLGLGRLAATQYHLKYENRPPPPPKSDHLEYPPPALLPWKLPAQKNTDFKNSAPPYPPNHKVPEFTDK